MTELGGLPFAWIDFDEDSKLTSTLPAWAIDGSISDVIVISHGWKTDRADAAKQYAPLIASIVTAWKKKKPAKPVDRTYAVLGVSWHSQKYDADYGDLTPRGSAGGAKSGAGSNVGKDLTNQQLAKIVAKYAAFVGLSASDTAALQERARAAAVDLDPQACREFLASALSPLSKSRDTETDADLKPYEPLKARNVLQKLTAAPSLIAAKSGGAKGLGSTLNDVFAGAKAAVGRLLNQLTFFEMKTRAGVVGQELSDRVLRKILKGAAVRVHLIGHSFGARLVTSAVHRSDASKKLRSLVLLQGAFSHNALSAAKKGAFAGAYAKISGVTMITHTHNDSAVTKAYALASRLSRDSTKKLGDKDDKFGAIGANGALFLPSGIEVPHAEGSAGPVLVGKVNNIRSDAFIADHMDIAQPRTGELIAEVLAA